MFITDLIVFTLRRCALLGHFAGILYTKNMLTMKCMRFMRVKYLPLTIAVRILVGWSSNNGVLKMQIKVYLNAIQHVQYQQCFINAKWNKKSCWVRTWYTLKLFVYRVLACFPAVTNSGNMGRRPPLGTISSVCMTMARLGKHGVETYEWKRLSNLCQEYIHLLSEHKK